MHCGLQACFSSILQLPEVLQCMFTKQAQRKAMSSRLAEDLQERQCVQHHVFGGPSAEAETTDRRDHILNPSQADSTAGRLQNILPLPAHPCADISPVFTAHVAEKCLLLHFCSAWATVRMTCLFIVVIHRHSNAALHD